MVKRKVRIPPKILEELGIFGQCRCGKNIRYYDDCGVKCEKCGALYGIRVFKRSAGGGYK